MKKTRILSTLMLGTILALTSTLLAACGSAKADTIHVHAWEKVSEQAATCQTPKIEYFKCAVETCGERKTEIGASADANAHNWVAYTNGDINATCQHAYLEYYLCMNNNCAERKIVENPEKGALNPEAHVLVRNSQKDKDATCRAPRQEAHPCTEEGCDYIKYYQYGTPNTEHWYGEWEVDEEDPTIEYRVCTVRGCAKLGEWRQTRDKE